MGMCQSSQGYIEGGNPEQAQRSKWIEKQLKRDGFEYSREIKLLMLGAGEAGKSTLAKQMKIIFNRGYSERERKEFISIIHSNILVAIRSICIACEKFGYQVDPNNISRFRSLQSNSIIIDQPSLEGNIVLSIEALWNDIAIKATRMFPPFIRFQNC